MTIYRNPVEASTMKGPLRCIDFNPAGQRVGTVCDEQFKRFRIGKGKPFRCPNLGASDGRCVMGAFSYPRKHPTEDFYHYHQGIDLSVRDPKTGRLIAGVPIISVTTGKVVHVQPSDDGSYGKAVMIESRVPGHAQPLYFFYAHCLDLAEGIHEGQSISERQVIAHVGATGNAAGDKPHLHFEVRTSKVLPKQHNPVTETTMDYQGLRLDPLVVLAQLGPWGMQEVFVPTQPERHVDPDVVTEALAKVEHSSRGGYYPLGANNTWHGGVHLDTAGGRDIVAPFDATIVALRLDSDPATSSTAVGDTNFILLRHELSEPAARLLRGKPADPKTEGIPNAVGRGAANEPEHVVQAKSGLHGRFAADGKPFYAPANLASLADPHAGEDLYEAIEAFQETLPKPKAMKKKHPWPDGVMSVGGYTWTALFGPTQQLAQGDDPGVDPSGGGGETPKPKSSTDPTRTLYCMLMHLGAKHIDAASPKQFPWLAGAEVAPRPGHEDDAAAEQRNKIRAEDEAEARIGITKRVGFPKPALDRLLDADLDPGLPADIEWVQKRLTRFGFFSGATNGVFTDELREAIAAFQREHTEFFAEGTGNEPPGFVQPKAKGKTTAKPETLLALQTTRAELLGESDEGIDGIDPLFVARLSERDSLGRAGVVSGLDIPVRSGEPLWVSGRAQGYDGPEELATFEQIHWEFFSEHPLVDWETLVDDSEDLEIDVPDRIFEVVEIHEIPGFVKDKRLVPAEVMEFYSHPRSQFLRRTACKFRSEWALDVPKWVSDLKALGFDVTSLLDDVRPFAVWNDVKDVLPSSPHVWHYNPIEFLGRYAEILEALKPRPVAPAGAPCRLRVRVTYADGQPWSYAHLALAYFGAQPIYAEADVSGITTWLGLAAGSGIVWLDEHASASAFMDLEPGDDQEFTMVAPVVGPARTTGTLRVFVLGTDSLGLGHVPVSIECDGALQPDRPTDADGCLVIELAPGAYAVTAEGVTAAIEIAAGGEFELELQRLDTGAIAVDVRFGDGSLAPRQEVTIDDGLAYGDTNEAGVVEFDRLLPGTYSVFVAGVPDTTRTVEVVAYATQQVHLVIPLGDTTTPTTDLGVIDVFLLDDHNAPCADQTVWLLDDGQIQLDDRTTDENGRATFDGLDPGTYGVSAENGASDELGLAIDPGMRKRVIVRVGPTPAPMEDPTGALDVFVVDAQGFARAGALVVLLDDAGAALAQATSDAAGLASFDDLAPGTYGVSVENAATDELGITVSSDERASVAVKLRAQAPKSEPKPAEPHGALRVTIVYADGAPVIGTVKVSTNGHSAVASKTLWGSEQGSATFEDLPSARYLVYLDGHEDQAVDVEVPPNAIVPVMILLPA